jgi:lipoprotein-anchoring transpeptidase ErfK/SrfK
MRILPLLLSFGLAAAAPATARDVEAAFTRAAADPGKVAPLLLEASAVILRDPGSAASHRLAERLEPFAKRAFFSHERLPGMETLGIAIHVVAKGELAGKIGKKLRFDAKLLERLNAGYDERKLAVGQTLKVLDLADRSLKIVVDKERHRLALWRSAPRGGRILMAYVPVGTGKTGSETPAGTTTVTKRVRNPEWTDPDTRQVFPHGDPGNVLGGFWIALDPPGLGGRTGIGFHGYTGAPAADWLEREASHGCVRMLQDDIARLYDVALSGTKVTILGPRVPARPE